MAVFEFRLMVGDKVATKFSVAGKLVEQGLSEGKVIFQEVCDLQPHPCSGCGGGRIVQFFVDNTYHENYEAYEMYVKGFVYMCQEIGVSLNPDSLFHSIQIGDLGTKFGFVNASAANPNVEFLKFEFLFCDVLIEMDFPKDDFRGTQESLRQVMDSLDHPCMNCAANFVLDGVEEILESAGDEELLVELLKAAYQIHIDLNNNIHGEPYPDDTRLIDLEELADRAYDWIHN